MEALSPQQIQNRLAKDPRDFIGQLAMGEALFKRGELEEALEYLTRAKLLFPGYGGDNSAYWYLAQIYRQQGDLEKGAQELAAFTRINESHYEAHLALAEVRESLGDLPGAAEALGRAVFIYPMEIAPHRRLAEIHRELGQFESAIPERQAVVALELVDRAQAIYELAFAYYEAGDSSNARREVLGALEIAPNFEDAQDLLLSLQPGSGREGAAARTIHWKGAE
jgi:tetratricopeptide (TPR) repeat protein